MKFFRSLFSKDPKERIRIKLTELEVGDKALELPKTINEDNFRLVREIAQEMLDGGELSGILIGKKGWFLPNGRSKLENVWKELETKGKIELDTLSTDWKINEKRVYIALTDFAQEKNVIDNVFDRDDLTIYFIPYLRDKWITTLAKYDVEDGVEFAKIMEQASIHSDLKEKFEQKIRTWINETGATYALGQDGILRLRNSIKDLVEEYIPTSFEEGIETITYQDIAQKYGITQKEVGEMLQKLVDNHALGEVTLYPLDQMIKSRN